MRSASRSLVIRPKLLVVFSLLICTAVAPGSSFAQWADSYTQLGQEVVSLYHQGDLSAAIEKQKQRIRMLDFEQEPANAWDAIQLLYILCQAPGMPGFTVDLDMGCIEWVTPYIESLPIVAGDPHATLLRQLYFLGATAVRFNDEEWLRSLFDRQFLESTEQPLDTIYYVNRQLIAAEAHIGLEEYSEARMAVERALATILSLENGHHQTWQVSRWFVAVCNLYLELNDIRMAQSLFAAASPLIFTSLVPDSPDMLTANTIGAAVYFKAGLVNEAHRYSDEIVRIADKLNEAEQRYGYVRDYALSVRLGSCFIIGDVECIKSIGNDEKQNLKIESALRQPKEPTLYTTLEYIVARAAVLYLVGDPISEKERRQTIKLIESQLPNWSDSDMTSTLRFALGMMLLQAGELEAAKEHFVFVAESTVKDFRNNSNKLAGHIPTPRTDRWIMWMMIVAMSAGGDYEADHQDLLVAMASGLQRTSINVEGDFLSLIANANSEHERQVAHSYLRNASRQRYSYTALANKLVQNILEDANNNPDVAPEYLRTNAAIRRQVSEYGQSRVRLLRQLNAPNSGVSALPLLSKIQNVMESNEALLLDTTFGGAYVTVCVRSDDVQIISAAIGDMQQALLDIKLIRLAIGASYAPSIGLDRQFPVQSAVRLHDIAIKPLKNCLREGDTVYVAGQADLLPWEVMLEKVPSRIGDGYDLASAQWAMKRYNFAYIGTALEFVSGKLIDKAGRRSTGFFGVGDPILEGKTEDGISRRGLVQRGMIRGMDTSLADLAELPDTARELETIGKLFRSDKLLLTREVATEAHLRRSQMGRFQFLSFATHGLMREELLGLREAALVLTPVNATDPLNDGLLTTSEIADFRLNARVAFLSACNTSSIDTDLFKSEVQSFSAAFASAGVPATITTTSYVDSLTARLIAEETFKNLIHDDVSVAQALASAKVAFAAAPPGPEYSHPRFWAPIVSMGNSLPRKLDAEAPLLEFVEHQTMSEGGGEVIAIAKDRNSDDYYARFIGNPIFRNDQDSREELQTFIAKIDAAGRTEWTWTKLGSGNSSAFIDTGRSLILPGVGVSAIENSVPVLFAELNALNKKSGVLEWSRLIDASKPSMGIADVILTSKDHILLLLKEWNSTDLDDTKTGLTLIRFDKNGDELHRRTILGLGDRLLKGRPSMVEDAGDIYVAYSTSIAKESVSASWDDFHNLNSCYIKEHSVVLRLNSESLEVIDKNVYTDREYNDAYAKSGSGLILIGREYTDCIRRGRLLVSEIEDGRIKREYRDLLSNNSIGRGVIALESGDFIVVGSESRPLASQTYTGVDQNESPDESSFDKERFNAITAMDGLVILLGPDLKEKGREWLEGGADASITTGVETSAGVLLGGLNGSTGVLTRVHVRED